MKKNTIAALVATTLTLTAATAAFAEELTVVSTPWEKVALPQPIEGVEPGSSLTISLAPVAMKDHRGTEFEKGYRAALGVEAPLMPGVALYNDVSYLTADRIGAEGDVSIIAATGGLKAGLLPGAGILAPYAHAGIGLAYIDQDGTHSGNDWRPVYTIGAGIASQLGLYRVDLGWQLDTVNATGGTLGAHTFSITTHVPLAW